MGLQFCEVTLWAGNSATENTHRVVSSLKCPLVMFVDVVLCWAWWDMKSKCGRRKKNTESTNWFLLSYTYAHRGQSSPNVQLSQCTELLRMLHPLLVDWLKYTWWKTAICVPVSVDSCGTGALPVSVTLSFNSTTIKWKFTPLNLCDSYSYWFHMSLRS